MRILFITMGFRSYREHIIEALERNFNAAVDMIRTDFDMTLIQRELNHLAQQKWYYKEEFKRQYEAVEALKKNQYDVIFVLLGYHLNISVFQMVLENYPNAYKVLYLWDSLENAKKNDRIVFADGNKFLTYFDDIYSFDPCDCKKYGYCFLPLFFTDNCVYDGRKKSIDLYCVGGGHSGRKEVLRNIFMQAKKNNRKVYFRLVGGRRDIIKSVLNGDWEDLAFITCTELGSNKNADLLKASKITIDLPSPTQVGLTMRTIEALSAHTKLVTTNKDVMNYDFYHPENIHIILREKPEIPDDFIESPYLPIEETIVQSYSINSWVRKLFAKM